MRRSTILFIAAVGISAGPASSRAAENAIDAQAVAALWEAPANLAGQDLFNGPWGARLAPNPDDLYTVVRHKHGGVSSGLVVRDANGHIWHVKQGTRNGRGVEGPVEVVLSRVLSAVGYHQPPVYYLPAFRVADASGSHVETGGRFRLDEPTLRPRGSWSWQQNPFVGTRPYNGLLVILLAFNSWDLKDSNNTLYEIRRGDRLDPWYVVRDLGGALGESGSVSPQRNNIDKFERASYLNRVRENFVEFAYHGKRPELIRNRITVDDLRWATSLLSALTARQWRDAFRAGGYPDPIGERFVRKIQANILQAQRLVGHPHEAAWDAR